MCHFTIGLRSGAVVGSLLGLGLGFELPYEGRGRVAVRGRVGFRVRGVAVGLGFESGLWSGLGLV